MLLSRLTNENGNEFTVNDKLTTNDGKQFNTLSEANSYILSKYFSYEVRVNHSIIERLIKRSNKYQLRMSHSTFGKQATNTLYTIKDVLKAKLIPSCTLTLTSKHGDTLIIAISHIAITDSIYLTYKQVQL